MSITDRDRLAIAEASKPFGKFTPGGIRKHRGGDPRFYKHTDAMLSKLLKRGYAVRLEKGLYQLTELGAAWCGAANVANP